jgi:hypothetical protein
MSSLLSVIAGLSRRIATGDAPDLAQKLQCGRHAELVSHVAMRTGGVPIYADFGAFYVLLSDLSVVETDGEGPINSLSDRRKILFAHKLASELFEELTPLAPKPPEGACVCEACGGSGISKGMACAVCCYLGWTAPGQ